MPPSAYTVCQFCDRPLTSPASQRIGAGPVCAGKHGIDHEDRVETFPVRGVRGSSRSAIKGLGKLIGKRKPRRVVLVSYRESYQEASPACQVWAHGLVLDFGDRIETIADAFTSGFEGETTRALAEALHMLAVPPMIDHAIMTRAQADALFTGQLDNARPIIDAMPLEVEWVADGAGALLDPRGRKLLVRILPSPAVEQLRLPFGDLP